MAARHYRRPRANIEWPTLFVLGICYVAWALITFFHEQIGLWLTIPGAIYAVALHSSLQHEALHGHPTRWRALNEGLIFFRSACTFPISAFARPIFGTTVMNASPIPMTIPKAGSWPKGIGTPCLDQCVSCWNSMPLCPDAFLLGQRYRSSACGYAIGRPYGPATRAFVVLTPYTPRACFWYSLGSSASVRSIHSFTLF